VEGLLLRRPNCTSALKENGREPAACAGITETTTMLNNENLVNVRRQTVERRGFMTISPYRTPKIEFSPTRYAAPAINGQRFRPFGRAAAESERKYYFSIVRSGEKEEERESGKSLE
jgi:hypothetical protein